MNGRKIWHRALRCALATIAMLGLAGTTTIVTATSASAYRCLDTKVGEEEAHLLPPSCTRPDTYQFECPSMAREVSKAWVGGNIRNYVHLEYSGYCRSAWARSSGPVWSGTIFTRTTFDRNKLHVYEDTLGRPIYGTHYTQQLRDKGRWAFGCAYDGHSWVCTGLY